MEISQMTDRRILRKLLIILSLLAMLVALSSCEKSKPGKDPETGNGKDPGTTVAPANGNADQILLPVVLPDAIVEGTPPNLSTIENLEYTKEARPPFYVPAGTVNLSLNKPVSGSDEDPIGGTISQVVDGDMNGADGTWLEFGLFEQQITVDLEKQCEISAILIWHFHKVARVYYDVVVQTADDADFVTNVNTLFNNDIDDTHGLGAGTDKNYVEKAEGKLIEGKGVRGRYVRFYSNGNNDNELNHYVEVAVYGKPVK